MKTIRLARVTFYVFLSIFKEEESYYYIDKAERYTKTNGEVVSCKFYHIEMYVRLRYYD